MSLVVPECISNAKKNPRGLPIAGVFLWAIDWAGVAGFRRRCFSAWLCKGVAPNALRAGRGISAISDHMPNLFTPYNEYFRE